MHRALWVLQIVLGIYFLFVGINHFVVPDGLPDQLAWMYDLSDGAHYVAGVAEILGGLGLILPGLTKIRPELSVWAAAGLILVMIGAVIWHLGRAGEASNVATNVVLILLLAFIAYGRSQRAPFPGTFGAPAT